MMTYIAQFRHYVPSDHNQAVADALRCSAYGTGLQDGEQALLLPLYSVMLLLLIFCSLCCSLLLHSSYLATHVNSGAVGTMSPFTVNVPDDVKAPLEVRVIGPNSEAKATVVKGSDGSYQVCTICESLLGGIF